MQVTGLTKASRDEKQLVYVRLSREQWLSSQQLSKQAADGPDVYGPAGQVQ